MRDVPETNCQLTPRMSADRVKTTWQHFHDAARLHSSSPPPSGASIRRVRQAPPAACNATSSAKQAKASEAPPGQPSLNGHAAIAAAKSGAPSDGPSACTCTCTVRTAHGPASLSGPADGPRRVEGRERPRRPWAVHGQSMGSPWAVHGQLARVVPATGGARWRARWPSTVARRFAHRRAPLRPTRR